MRHVPVLLNEVIESLQLSPGHNVVDCTLGDGGHAGRILELTAPNGKLVGIDSDPEALLRAKKYLYEFQGRIKFVRDNFVNLEKIIEREKFGPVHSVLFDLGWSSPQFEERGRGFSFLKRDELLDMRYDPISECDHEHEEDMKRYAVDGSEIYEKCTAADILNSRSQKEIEQIFKKFGEEKLSFQIAQAVVQRRESCIFETVGDFVDLVCGVYRKKLKSKEEVPWVGGLHPATKAFQALRIVVNREIEVIERALPHAVEVLASKGRIAVISFHSLEDRIVKHFFKSKKGKELKIITKKPITPSKEECEANPRARSAKLRVAEKL